MDKIFSKYFHRICLVSTLLFLIGVTAECAPPVKVVKSSAQAWISVAPGQQQELVNELHQFAQSKGFQFNPSEQPGPSWQMIGVIMVTPASNEISIINATSPNRFSIFITVYHPGEKWSVYWEDLRRYLSAHHDWTEVRGKTG